MTVRGRIVVSLRAAAGTIFAVVAFATQQWAMLIPATIFIVMAIFFDPDEE